MYQSNLIKIATSQGEILRENINFDYRFCPLNMPFWAEFKLNFGFDTLKDEALKMQEATNLVEQALALSLKIQKRLCRTFNRSCRA